MYINFFKQSTKNWTVYSIYNKIFLYYLQISEHLIGRNKNITKTYKEPKRCTPKRLFVTETIPQLELPVLRDFENNHIREASVRSSRSSFIETMALSGSESSSCRQHFTRRAIFLVCLLSLSFSWFARWKCL